MCVLWLSISAATGRPSLHMRSQPNCKPGNFFNKALLLSEIFSCSQTAQSTVHLMGLTDEIHILLVSNKAAEIMLQCFKLTIRILDLFEAVEKSSPGARVLGRLQ